VIVRRRSRLEQFVRDLVGPYGPDRYISADRSEAVYSRLSADPPIFYVAHWLDEQLRVNQARDQLHRYLRDRHAYFLYTWYWCIEEARRVRAARIREQRQRRRYRNHRFVHLCNTRRQHELFAAAGLETVFCNQNALVDERVFRPLPELERRFDAVYDARLNAYKRHELAAEIQSLALIYATSATYDDPKYASDTLRLLAHAHRFNEDSGHAYRMLRPEEVNRCLNECRVGLCLSAVEGAMYASIQYLLAGLPVVSTESRGGRDVFFDRETTLIVDADPAAVRAGVREMARRDLPADQIRAHTIEKIRPHREAFIETVQSIYDREGITRRFADEWPTLRFNTMLRRQGHADTIAELDALNLPAAASRAGIREPSGLAESDRGEQRFREGGKQLC
jgi:glycosyltransferase involved in cell wall biosynthesis